MRTKRHVTEKTKLEVYERDSGKCVLCPESYLLERTPHHCMYGGESITDESRNSKEQLVTICLNCHFDIHSRGNNEKRDDCIKYIFNLYGKEFYIKRGFKRQINLDK
jgi:5-methylcytosine-specific restriction endonuclease McrA